MFCPKCGTAMEEGVNVCPNCCLDITTINKDPAFVTELDVANTVESNVETSKKFSYYAVKYIYFGLAAVVLILFFLAASNIASSGNEIMQIQSVGGRTLEEAYYYELGSIYAGYAMISRALGIFFASVLVWLGIKS